MKRAIQSSVNLLLVLALAAMCTYWVLQFTAVRKPQEPVVMVPTGDRIARTQPIDTAGAAALFGTGSPGAASRVRLTGIIAEGGKGNGVALLSVDGQPAMAYRVDEPINPDMVLTDVNADRVLIRTADGALEVRMPERPVPGVMTSGR